MVSQNIDYYRIFLFFFVVDLMVCDFEFSILCVYLLKFFIERFIWIRYVGRIVIFGIGLSVDYILGIFQGYYVFMEFFVFMVFNNIVYLISFQYVF